MDAHLAERRPSEKRRDAQLLGLDPDDALGIAFDALEGAIDLAP
jgi:hypothetical protein